MRERLGELMQKDAVKFVEETGCDTLAIAIGTAHGLYPKDFEPHLKQGL